jgi:formylglycine-generating enzyme required for sulfatase activity
VREGRTVLGQTPLSLTQLRPRDLHLSVDLPPYTLQRLDLHVPDFGNVSKQVTLQQDKDFIAACGMPLVWIPDGGFWAGKYLVRQSDFETVAGYNPSTFRRPNRPVETISWESAMAFFDKLNQYERKAGKLPQGYHYTLPKESQWSVLSDDADIDQAATSRVTTLSSTQDAGYSEPNTYGIYDSIGNVWEWCLDAFDEKGDHGLRGGCWLSSAEHFPNADTRNAGGPKYADQFTGFRVVLVPN